MFDILKDFKTKLFIYYFVFFKVKMVKKGEGPKQELIDALKPMTQFQTSQEFNQFINNLCVEKELKVS